MNNHTIDGCKWMISQVKREIKHEPDKYKKQRLNKYKQKLEIELRNLTRSRNLGLIKE